MALKSAGSGTWRRGGRETRGPVAATAAANGPRAARPGAKPDDTTGYRTFSADCAAWRRSTRSIRDDDTDFFLAHPPCDSPRAVKNRPIGCPPGCLAVAVRVAVGTVGDDAAGPVRTAGSTGLPATDSNAAPPVGKPGYNSGPTHRGCGTRPRSPSTGTAAVAAKPHCGAAARPCSLALNDNRNKLKVGPREGRSLTVKSRRQAPTCLRGGCFPSQLPAGADSPLHAHSSSPPSPVRTSHRSTSNRDRSPAPLAPSKRQTGPAQNRARQVTLILAVACEPPEQSGRPIDRWTHRELADEVVRRGIVSSISVSQVGRYLAEAELQPHRSKYWLNTKEKDPEVFQQQVETV